MFKSVISKIVINLKLSNITEVDMFKQFILAVIVVLCLGLIGCTEPNIPNEPIDNLPSGTELNEPDDTEQIDDGPIIIKNRFVDRDLARSTLLSILYKSDLIIIGYFYKTDFPASGVESSIEIIEVLKGTTKEKEAIYKPYTDFGGGTSMFSPSEGQKYILSLRKEGEYYVFTGAGSEASISTMDLARPSLLEGSYREYDFKLLMSAYDKNKELGKKELILLYPQLQSELIKESVSMELCNQIKLLNIDEYDIEIIAIGLQSEDNMIFHLTCINYAGMLKIEQFKETIVNMLLTTPDNDVNSWKISHILSSLGWYEDIKFKDIFLEYINSKRDEYRYVSYQAIGRLGDEATILALVPYYAKEKDATYRSAILTALENIKNNDVLIPVLLELKKIETQGFMIQRIDEIIAKRGGEGTMGLNYVKPKNDNLEGI